MSTMSVREIAEALVAQFGSEKISEIPYEGSKLVCGMRGITLSRNFLVSDSVPNLIARLREVLPEDAKIVDLDGNAIRMRGANSDAWSLVVSSVCWEPLGEGESIPDLGVLFHSEGVSRNWHYLGQAAKRLPPPAFLLHVALGADYLLKIDKDTHEIVFEKDLESERYVYLSIKSKER